MAPSRDFGYIHTGPHKNAGEGKKKGLNGVPKKDSDQELNPGNHSEGCSGLAAEILGKPVGKARTFQPQNLQSSAYYSCVSYKEAKRRGFIKERMKYDKEI